MTRKTENYDVQNTENSVSCGRPSVRKSAANLEGQVSGKILKKQHREHKTHKIFDRGVEFGGVGGGSGKQCSGRAL